MDELLDDIRRARNLLPLEHRALLDQLRVQEAAIEDWPRGVCDLYQTIQEVPPSQERLAHAAAVWLDALRMVAFNASWLRVAVRGLDDLSRKTVISHLAWHEYGHALSLTRSSREQREDGPRLLTLLPRGIREVIDYPGVYRRLEVFDEVVAGVYAVMVARVRSDGYGAPDFLHPDVFQAFKEVIPWPPSR